jgi:putative ABC transport system permease protein
LRYGLRAVLVGAQVALAFMLLVGAALLLRSFSRLTSVPAGISTDQVLTMRVSVPPDGYAERQRVVAFFERLLEGVRAAPGVRFAGAVTNLPLGDPIGDWDFYLPGETPGPQGSDRAADWQVVTPGYFEAMGVPLRGGRFITMRDAPDAPAVVVINETLARTYFPERDPIGLQIRMSGLERPWMTIVGIAGDVRHTGLDAAAGPQVYMPHAQFVPFWRDTTARSLSVVIRSDRDAGAIASAVRARVRELDPDLAVAQVRPMDAVLARSLAAERLQVQLLAVFAAIALVLAVVGTYGVLAYQITERTREFGVRMALGAKAADIVRMVVRQGMAPAAAGVLLGIGGAAAATRLLETLLFETEPLDPVAFGGTAAVLLAAALAACLLPARRATRVDPSTALRAE